VGAINLPIIKFSVEWWNTLHQPASILRAGGPSIDGSMLTPLLVLLAAATCLTVTLLFLRVEAALLEQKIRRLQIMRISHKDAAL
jgi:heme exporter protein C